MFGLLVFLFTVVPALELYLLFSIGAEIGILNTVAIIFLTGVTGAYLAKSQGLYIIYRLQKELSEGKMPAEQILHGLIVFGGGLLLLTPGFMTDIFGFCMVLPGTRHLIMKFAYRYFERA